MHVYAIQNEINKRFGYDRHGKDLYNPNEQNFWQVLNQILWDLSIYFHSYFTNVSFILTIQLLKFQGDETIVVMRELIEYSDRILWIL